MKLRNPFSEDTRWLFFDTRFNCFLCGRNDTELHHIGGRVSSSPLNAAVLCKECHLHVTHSEEEEMRLFRLTLRYLIPRGYRITMKDLGFIQDYPRLAKVVYEERA